MGTEGEKGGLARHRWVMEVVGGALTVICGLAYAMMESEPEGWSAWMVVVAGGLVLMIGVAGALSARSGRPL